MLDYQSLVHIFCSNCSWPMHVYKPSKCVKCGQVNDIPLKAIRQAKVTERVLQNNRLISWLMFLRRQSDRGVGDTAERMFLQADERDIKALLKRLLSSCNCRTEDAAEHLNKQYPYA